MRAPLRWLIPTLAVSTLSPLPFGAHAAAEESAPSELYVRAARLIVRPGEVLEPGVVHVVGDRIRAAAGELAIPEGATVLEAPVVCAGFIDSWSALGVVRDSLGDQTTQAASRTKDGIDPYGDDHLREEALRAGVVAARVQAGSWARIGGVGALVRLTPEQRPERIVLQEDAVVAATIGVTRQRAPGAPAVDPFDRIDELDKLVAALEKAERYGIDQTEYRHELAAWEKTIAEKEKELEEGFKKAKKDREKELETAKEKGKEFKEKRYKEDKRPRAPRFDEDSEVLRRVVDGELPLVIEAHRAAEIRELLKGTARFDRLRLVLAGGTEALHFAEELAARSVKVLLWPAPAGDLGWDELEGHDLSLAGRLSESGVEVLLGSGGSNPAATRDLPLVAQLAVGHGLEREKAFEALTLGAARAFDAADRLGSVEAGKAADLLLLDGEPLAATTRVLSVVSAGRVVVPAAR